ncbi:prenyltransferase/squalene oxidase repeat-containing protein [Streptomyces sp. NRRL S-646]|uniref:prenyltransferase/squalene oxidase repeat-containing protein n=1 Tax=Streptomyces sp. NRRL S-646 TaxID=1463917 RepID=UPI0013318FF8|nr:prenyltransferase/squalene oxidase repeat-containing protein [Streptomyces sp. NRRL S-646]
MSAPPSLRTFVLEQFLDADARLPAVLGRDAADVITPDRTLRDASLALLVLPGPDDLDLTARLLAALREFTDPEQPGFRELLDVTGAAHPVGDIRTPATQALAAWALHRAGVLLYDAALTAEARERLDRVTGAVLRHDWPARLDRSWSTVLDGASPLEDTALLVLAADAVTTSDAPFLDTAAHHLERYVHGDGVWAALTPRGEPDTLHGHRARASALAALAWTALHRRGHSAAADRARRALLHIQAHHGHTGARGYWDRSGADSVVRVDPIAALHGRPDSPFPAKLVADHALLALAARRTAALMTGDDSGVPHDDDTAVRLKALAEDAAAEVERYTDVRAGGVFQGQGSWFSTPVDPTVPLARHVLVPPRSTGSFAVGNTTYVPFHGKHAHTQLLALWALGDRVPTAPAAPALTEPPEPDPFDNDLGHVTSAPVTDGLVDFAAYLRWLRSTQSGLGYGLTPYRAPLGLRSDRTAQTFSVLHVVSDLLALGEEVPDVPGVLRGVFATQNPDGGFGEQPSLPSETFTTYCAVLTAVVLGGGDHPDFDRDACVRFLKDCQRPEGGFGNAPGFPADAWHSHLATLTLVALDARPERPDDLVAFLLACQNPDGGYGNLPGSPSDTFATFRVVGALIALGLRPPHAERTSAWLHGLQTEAGGFRYRDGSVESFVGSYHAIGALYMLGALHSGPADTDACVRWIAVRQSADGGFSRTPGGPSETTDEGFIAVQALHMLEGKLNRSWAVMMT